MVRADKKTTTDAINTKPARRHRRAAKSLRRQGRKDDAVAINEPAVNFEECDQLNQSERSWPGSFLLTDKCAAAWFDISRATFWRRVRDGTLPPPIRLAGVTRWRRDELLEAIDRATARRDGGEG